jgi:hypothetical protein
VNADGSRIPKEMRPSAIAALKNHDQRENGRLMAAAFRVNGLRVVPVEKAQTTQAKRRQAFRLPTRPRNRASKRRPDPPAS